MKIKSLLLATLVIFASSLASAASFPNKKVGWIDVHFHIVGNKGDLESFTRVSEHVLKIMQQKKMSRILIMSPPRPRQSFDVESIAHLAEQYPERIAFMAGGGSLNPMLQKWGNQENIPEEIKQKFKALAEKYIAMGAKGFGEIAAHHVSLTPTHGYESTPADNPLLLILADVAAEHNVPIDLHFDPVPADVPKPHWLKSPNNPDLFKENISAFERLLQHNRNAKIVWAHAGSDPVGFFTPKLAKQLLAKHPNLYLSIRPLNPRPGSLYHPQRGFNPKWLKLIKNNSERIVIGTDSFIVTDNYNGHGQAPKVFQERTARQREAVLTLLNRLPKPLALQLGRKNAIRIYRLNE